MKKHSHTPDTEDLSLNVVLADDVDNPTLSAASKVHEVEFKLCVPPGEANAVSARLERKGAATVKALRAHYFDTVDDVLAAAGFSLRLREQDGRWIQTLKKSYAQANLRRVEHEVEVEAPAGRIPPIDLDRHGGTVIGAAAAVLLKDAAGLDGSTAKLTKRYGTDVSRRSVLLTWRGSQIEVSFDKGRLVAGTRSLPICELELELKLGDAATLSKLARRWMRRHNLWLEAESKAERARRFAHGVAQPPVVKANPPAIETPASIPAVVASVMASCVSHILPNAAAVAAGSIDEEHIHQLRVGLRRLRTALRELDELGAGLPRDIERPVVEVFRALGAHRDQQTVLEAVKPQLLAAGATNVDWATAAPTGVNLADVVRTPEFQAALIKAAAYALSEPNAKPRSRTRLQRRVRPVLQRLHRDVVRNGKRFTRLSEEEQHAVRKELKRLRYVSEFVAPLYDETAVDHYLEALRPAQDMLGTHNDFVVAGDLAQQSSKVDAGARFAAQWLARAQEKSARKSHKKLRRVAQAQRFWK